jgi:hypothetical protein
MAGTGKTPKVRMLKTSRIVLAFFIVGVYFLSEPQNGAAPIVRWEKKITSPYAGVTFKSIIPVSILAIAFSPDKKYVAFSAGFIEYERQKITNVQGRKGVDYERGQKTVVVIASADNPDAVRKRSEIPLPPWLNEPSLVWSPDGQYIAATFREYNYDQEIILSLADDTQYVIHNHMCDFEGVVSGPEVALQCSDVKLQTKDIRFVGLDESVHRKYSLPLTSWVLAIEPTEAVIAIRAKDAGSAYNQMVFLDGHSGSELYRWTLPPTGEKAGAFVDTYNGTFAESGKLFCVVPFVYAGHTRQITCRTTDTGKEVGHIPVNWGGSGVPRVIGGNRLMFLEENLQSVPKALVSPSDTQTFIGKSNVVVSDFRSGALLAVWRMQNQKVLPKWDGSFASPGSDLLLS